MTYPLLQSPNSAEPAMCLEEGYGRNPFRVDAMQAGGRTRLPALGNLSTCLVALRAIRSSLRVHLFKPLEGKMFLARALPECQLLPGLSLPFKMLIAPVLFFAGLVWFTKCVGRPAP